MSEDTLYEIAWWKMNIFKAFKPIRYLEISIIIYTDDSLEGWGASMGNVSTGQAWLPDEKLMHINVLELRAILLALKSFAKQIINTLKSCLTIPQQSTALTKWEHHIQWNVITKF